MEEDKNVSDIVMKTWKWYQFPQYLWPYVNFENGFACWENFENHHPEKLRKSQKFAKKISVVEFRYCQTIIFRFTVTLFHSNLDEKIISNEQIVHPHFHPILVQPLAAMEDPMSRSTPRQSPSEKRTRERFYKLILKHII